MKKIILVLVIFVVLTTLSGCGTRVSEDIKDTGNANQKTEITSDKSVKCDEITYVNQEYGFSLVFPGYWQDQYTVENVQDVGIRIHHKPTWLKNGSGTLFQITVFYKTKNGWDNQWKGLDEGVGLRKLYDDDKVIVGFSTPTDVQYILDDKVLNSEYMKMENEVSKIAESFKKIN